MGGTSQKVLDKYKKFKNNFVAASTLFTDETKLLIFYPTLVSKNKINKNFKFIYISENKVIDDKTSMKIWNENKDRILKNLGLIDKIEFWKNLVDIKNDPVQRIYINIKSLIRIELVHELNKLLTDKLILVGSNWKNLYPNALSDNYSNKFISLYKGNICLDLEVKIVKNIIYLEAVKLLKVEVCYFNQYIKIAMMYF